MHPVKSGTIAEIGFSESKLYITFHSGNTYRYDNISQDQFIELDQSKSKGSTLKEIVKNKSYKQIERDLEKARWYEAKAKELKPEPILWTEEMVDLLTKKHPAT